MTRRYLESPPPRVRHPLTYRVAGTLQTVVHHHTLKGLLKPAC